MSEGQSTTDLVLNVAHWMGPLKRAMEATSRFEAKYKASAAKMSAAEAGRAKTSKFAMKTQMSSMKSLIGQLDKVEKQFISGGIKADEYKGRATRLSAQLQEAYERLTKEVSTGTSAVASSVAMRKKEAAAMAAQEAEARDLAEALEALGRVRAKREAAGVDLKQRLMAKHGDKLLERQAARAQPKGGGWGGYLAAEAAIDAAKMEKSFGAVQRQSSRIANAVSGIGSGIKGAYSGMQRLGWHFFLIEQSARQIAMVVGGIGELAYRGAKVRTIEKSFENMSKAVGAVDLEALNTALDGTVSRAKQLQFANLGMSLQIPSDAIPKLAAIAKAAAQNLGIATEQMYSDIMTGTARQSKRVLDNLGIKMENLAALWRQKAREMGKNVQDLTEQEKNQIFIQQVLANSTHILAAAGKGAANEYERFKANIENLTDSFGKALDEELKQAGVLTRLNELIEKSGSLTATFAGWLGAVVGHAAKTAESLGSIVAAIDAINRGISIVSGGDGEEKEWKDKGLLDKSWEFATGGPIQQYGIVADEIHGLIDATGDGLNDAWDHMADDTVVFSSSMIGSFRELEGGFKAHLSGGSLQEAEKFTRELRHHLGRSNADLSNTVLEWSMASERSSDLAEAFHLLGGAAKKFGGKVVEAANGSEDAWGRSELGTNVDRVRTAFMAGIESLERWNELMGEGGAIASVFADNISSIVPKLKVLTPLLLASVGLDPDALGGLGVSGSKMPWTGALRWLKGHGLSKSAWGEYDDEDPRRGRRRDRKGPSKKLGGDIAKRFKIGGELEGALLSAEARRWKKMLEESSAETLELVNEIEAHGERLLHLHDVRRERFDRFKSWEGATDGWSAYEIRILNEYHEAEKELSAAFRKANQAAGDTYDEMMSDQMEQLFQAELAYVELVRDNMPASKEMNEYLKIRADAVEERRRWVDEQRVRLEALDESMAKVGLGSYNYWVMLSEQILLQKKILGAEVELRDLQMKAIDEKARAHRKVPDKGGAFSIFGAEFWEKANKYKEVQQLEFESDEDYERRMREYGRDFTAAGKQASEKKWKEVDALTRERLDPLWGGVAASLGKTFEWQLAVGFENAFKGGYLIDIAGLRTKEFGASMMDILGETIRGYGGILQGEMDTLISDALMGAGLPMLSSVLGPMGGGLLGGIVTGLGDFVSRLFDRDKDKEKKTEDAIKRIAEKKRDITVNMELVHNGMVVDDNMARQVYYATKRAIQLGEEPLG